MLAPLSAVSGIIERRHTLPILSNVLIERSGDALASLATDIEIQITARSAIRRQRRDARGHGRRAQAAGHPAGAAGRRRGTLQQQDKRLQ